MSAKYRTSLFNADGLWIGGGEGFLPEYLDWMPIKVKSFWFRYMARGHPDTEYALLSSQGEQMIIIGVSLSEYDLKTHLEKDHGAKQAVDEFIDKGGFSRTPRNQ